MKLCRWGLLLVAAAILPSCGTDYNYWVWVTVRNHGTVSADVRSEAEYWTWVGGWDEHQDLSVSPGDTDRFGFRFQDLDRLHVRIFRSSDDLKIFEHTWDRHDLENLDQRITITVDP
jgi:hypothetical protein